MRARVHVCVLTLFELGGVETTGTKLPAPLVSWLSNGLSGQDSSKRVTWF